MTLKTIFFLLTVSFYTCNGTDSVDENLNNKNTATTEGIEFIVKQEKSFSQKSKPNYGELISSVSFQVKTDNTEDFEDGTIPWASIENPEEDLINLVDGDEIIIPDNKIIVIIDYPLTNEYRFELESMKGFSRKQLLIEVSKNYFKIYEEEEKSATIKTIPVEKRTKMYNRNKTDGKYGIWGHDIADLVLSEIEVYKSSNGEIILALFIES